MALLVGMGLWRGSAKWRLVGSRLAVFSTFGFLAFAVLPVGPLLYGFLENRFPVLQEDELPSQVDGIIALGGALSPQGSAKRKQLQIGGAVERITSLVALAQRYPSAKVVFTGGSGSLTNQELKEADLLKDLLPVLKINPQRVILERESRNTIENAKWSAELVNPKPDETWLLVTSAFHMPRALGVFRKQGWKVMPYPVDFATSPGDRFRLGFDLVGGLGSASGAIREIMGLIAYRVLGKTAEVFPAQ